MVYLARPSSQAYEADWQIEMTFPTIAEAGAFVALILPGVICPERSERFRKIVGCEPHLVLTSKTRVALVAWSSGTSLARSADGLVAVLVYGDMLPPGPITAQELLEQYVAAGEIPAKDINGSAAGLVMDLRLDRILALTDRLNSRKLFYSDAFGEQWVSTHLRLQPTTEHSPDAIGVGWYLSNGAIYSDRTIYDGIRVLERACISQLEAGRIQSKQYWDYRIEVRKGLCESELVHQMQQLLVQSVRRCTFDVPDIFLSLSGGYDVAGVLGILTEQLGISDIKCFSYSRGKPKRGSDEAVAAALAADLGLPHQVIPSYTGDYQSWIEKNALLGGGCSCLCDEVAAWVTVGQQCAAFEHPVVFAGDEALGWVDCYLREEADALACTQILGIAPAEWFVSMLSASVASAMREGVEADLSNIKRDCPRFSDLHDLKDYLYVTRRLSSTILPWRQYFAGTYVPVRNALLDRDIVDFMGGVPTVLRRQKKLYRIAIQQLAPRVFASVRATGASYHIDHGVELARHQVTLQQELVRCNSRLDALIPPDVLGALLRRLGSMPQSMSLRQLAVRAGKATLQRIGLKDALRRFDRRIQSPAISTATLLARALVLRAVFRK